MGNKQYKVMCTQCDNMMKIDNINSCEHIVWNMKDSKQDIIHVKCRRHDHNFTIGVDHNGEKKFSSGCPFYPIDYSNDKNNNCFTNNCSPNHVFLCCFVVVMQPSNNDISCLKLVKQYKQHCNACYNIGKFNKCIEENKCDDCRGTGGIECLECKGKGKCARNFVESFFHKNLFKPCIECSESGFIRRCIHCNNGVNRKFKSTKCNMCSNIKTKDNMWKDMDLKQFVKPINFP